MTSSSTSSSAPRRGLTTGAAGRAQLVVERVLSRAALRGERVVAFTRLCLCALGGLLWPFAVAQELARLAVAAIVVEVCFLAGAAFSAATLLALRSRQINALLRRASILVDAVLVLAILGAFVFFPPADYAGLTHTTGFGIAYLAIVAAGVRLSRRDALLSLVVVGGGVLVLVFVDLRRNPIAGAGDAAELLTCSLFLAASGALSFMTARRTRQLVLEGAEQALLAERARARLGSYVSEEVAAQSLADDEMRIGGTEQRCAVLFSDLRSFTSMSEGREPAALVRELNEYFEEMVAAVKSEGGVVDKYIGDAIMAVFGAPQERPDDAVRAIRAAKKMNEGLVRLNAARATRSLPPLGHGIGVHFGVVVAGNIGTAERAQYTIIGDTVNAASRLEAATKDAGVSVLLSDAVVVRARAVDGAVLPDLAEHGPVALRGKQEQVLTHRFAE